MTRPILPLLLVLRAFTGFVAGGVLPVSNAVIAGHAPDGPKGSVYGVSSSLNAFGRALGPILRTFVVTSWCVAGIFPVTGALLAIVTVMVIATTRDLSTPEQGAEAQ